MRRIIDLAADLQAGRTSSRALVENCLDRIADPQGEGARTFLKVWSDRARSEADYWDYQRSVGHVPTPIAGLPVSVKDLFDVAGETTRAGSKVREGHPPATSDAAVVRRLRAAGAILIGRTNMSEFAFWGLGINPHYGTPANPWDRARRRVPGGSSSGAAVSVTEGMCAVAIGTDTGGSVRIPAALCGIAGFKPTASRIPLDGVYPLSPSLDSIGPLGTSVSCCIVVDAIMAGHHVSLAKMPVNRLRLAAARGLVLEDLDARVQRCYERALDELVRAGARIVDFESALFDEVGRLNAAGVLGGAENLSVHRELWMQRREEYDPMVTYRLDAALGMQAADYVDAQRARADVIARAVSAMEPFDAILMPTCPTIAPAIDEVTSPQSFVHAARPLRRNTTLVNFLDGCAATLPIHVPGDAPVGLMLVGARGSDATVLRAGLSIEAILDQALK